MGNVVREAAHLLVNALEEVAESAPVQAAREAAGKILDETWEAGRLSKIAKPQELEPAQLLDHKDTSKIVFGRDSKHTIHERGLHTEEIFAATSTSFREATDIDGLSVQKIHLFQNGDRKYLNSEGLEGPESATIIRINTDGSIKKYFERPTPVDEFTVQELHLHPADGLVTYVNRSGLAENEPAIELTRGHSGYLAKKFDLPADQNGLQVKERYFRPGLGTTYLNENGLEGPGTAPRIDVSMRGDVTRYFDRPTRVYGFKVTAVTTNREGTLQMHHLLDGKRIMTDMTRDQHFLVDSNDKFHAIPDLIPQSRYWH